LYFGSERSSDSSMIRENASMRGRIFDSAKKLAAWGRKEIRGIAEKIIDEASEIDQSLPPGTAGPAADETAP